MKLLTLLPIFVEVALAVSLDRGYKRHLDHGHHANKTIHSSAYHHHKKPHHDHGCSNGTHTNGTHLPPHDNTSYTSPPSYTPPSYTTTTTTPRTTPKPSMTTSTTTTTPTSTTPAGGSESSSYIQEALDGHNKIRAQHGASPLTWSDTVAKAAETWANKCVWKHSMGATGDYGENMAAGSGAFSMTDAIAMWGAEEKDYDPKNPVYSHYTQIVWKATKTLGCHTTTCNSLQGLDGGPMQFIVCNYDPPGNVEGEFGDNVQ